MFRGREVTHPERGEMILSRLADELAEIAIVEQRPLQDGRNMTMMLAPSAKVVAEAAAAEAPDAAAPAAEAPAAEAPAPEAAAADAPAPDAASA